MDEPIILRARIERKGYNAALRGDAPDAHHMNHGSAAMADWNRGYALGLAEAAEPHHAPAGAERIDARQAGC
ncbi:hypothetical protein HF313_15000 [Massilia atriviolacea]|uniref:Uncharacterized protein n=1 Tax=Massilia atriviolacea TaxID=2495579 RepID=A0A430HR63_9BURK|nr:hypothetical protein [Massilia atriviolacea]RSZ60020.1 hypothetical protein EJB06_07525 [Massilia atriviolacea]